MENNEVINNQTEVMNNQTEEKKTKYVGRNRKTLAQLMREENDGFDIYPAKTPGKFKFICGKVTGYVSRHIMDKLEEVQVEDIIYDEIKAINKEGEVTWVPTLFLASLTGKSLKHFSLKDIK